jgi:hypothetical protein
LNRKPSKAWGNQQPLLSWNIGKLRHGAVAHVKNLSPFSLDLFTFRPLAVKKKINLYILRWLTSDFVWRIYEVSFSNFRYISAYPPCFSNPILNAHKKSPMRKQEQSIHLMGFALQLSFLLSLTSVLAAPSMLSAGKVWITNGPEGGRVEVLVINP